MIKHIVRRLAIVGLMLGFSTISFAKIQEYSLVLNKESVNISGKPLERITVNGTIPGPTLEFTNGDEAVIHVTNKMKEHSSVHWHGLLLSGEMDGAPGFNGFLVIKPGETFTYRFKIRQDGTYWYHAHSMAQEQDGHYGSIVIHPKGGDKIKTERDYVVLFSDFHEHEGRTIMSNLKKSSEHYVYVRRTLGDFFSSVKEHGFAKAWESEKMWGEMRMLPTDLADIGNYTFLVNGKTPDQNWTGLFKLGEKVRLRFINASAMSFYDVRIPGLEMTVVAADGQAVEPVKVDEFRFGVAETYDVLVEPKEEKAYTIVAEPLDRTGFALATLAPREGMRGEKPEQRSMSLLTMADMGMAHGTHSTHSTSGTNHSAHHPNSITHSDVDHSSHTSNAPNIENTTGSPVKDFVTGVPGSGWVNANTPEGKRALSYKDLRYLGVQKDQRMPEREITVRLGGNMERYIWTLNGKKYEDSGPIHLNYGERVRLIFINDTMMAHPMHLHGMFVQLENGQPMSKLPNKHTFIIAPGDTYTALLTADEVGEWAFHCHLLYHMMAGMMNKVVVAKLDDSKAQKMMKHQKHPMKNMDHSHMHHRGHDMSRDKPITEQSTHPSQQQDNQGGNSHVH